MRKNHLMGAFAAFVLAAALLLSFVGCADKNGGDQTVTTPSVATDTADVTTSFDPFAHLGDNDSYRGSEFCILNGCVASWFTRNSVVSEELDGDPISYAITRRAARVAEKYGVTLTEISDPNSKNSADKAISTDSLYFDVAMITLMNVYPMAQRHLFYDYNALDGVDLSNPWWDHNAVNDLSVCGKLYFCTGSFDITRFDSIRCLAFNKDMLNSLSLESPYDLVDSGKWTIDKFIELGETAKIDYGADSKYTDEDTYGFGSYNDVINDMLLSGCGIKYITKNADDELIFDMNYDKLTVVSDKIRKIMHDPGFTFDSKSDAMKPYCRGMGTRVLEQLLVEGRTLFYSECLANTRYFRESSINYGIVPPPKYDEAQERYYSVMINPFMYCIPSNIADPERTGFLLDAYMASSHDTVVPAYYDITLVGKIARDPETVKMLGIVFDSLSYNIHISNVKVRSTIQSEINRNSIGVVSAIKRIARVVPESLAKVNEDMKG